MGCTGFPDGLRPEDVVLFAGAHPDDETVIGPLLAYCADRCRRVVVLSLTRGESGHNLTREDMTHTLSQVREMEFRASVGAFGGLPIMLDYVNGTSRAHPGGLAVLDLRPEAHKRWRAAGRETPEQIRTRWTEQTGDPVEAVLALLRANKPSAVITLDLERGFTDHVEHIALAHITRDAVSAYNREADAKATLYYAYDPKGDVQEGEHILTSDLNRLGGKDYFAVAAECRVIYESQFGPRGSQESTNYSAARSAEALLRRPDAG
ncbi:MAG: PIG-L family deacetylase [Candidatus Brocadiaceae bacterium]|nr:PIG-L family deacetylase [Candidatus Brocadiaceae bacterium]